MKEHQSFKRLGDKYYLEDSLSDGEKEEIDNLNRLEASINLIAQGFNALISFQEIISFAWLHRENIKNDLETKLKEKELQFEERK